MSGGRHAIPGPGPRGWPRGRWPSRGAGRTATAVALVLLATGCGIRTTTVPVDAGSAPSRLACALSAERVPSPAAEPSRPAPSDTLRVDRKVVYLVCNEQVDRVVRRGEVTGRRLEVAGELLRELGRDTSGREMQQQYETAVPPGLKVSGPRPDEPRDALRLSERLDDLDSFALAQIVCTLSHTLADGGEVSLGGPGDDPLRRFQCTTELRTDGSAGTEAGTPLRDVTDRTV